MVGHLDEVGIYWDWNQMHISSIGIYYICVLDWYLDHMCAFGIWIEMPTLGNFHGGLYSRNNLFSWWCSLMKYYILYVIVILSWNQFHEGDSHEIPNSHEIYFMTVTLTKYWTLTKSVHDGDLSWNSTKYRHENTDANLVATLFSWGWPSWTPTTKRIHGGELSWKWDFRVSIIVRVDAWRCILTYYFCESKTIFRDVFCTLTKSTVSGSGWLASLVEKLALLPVRNPF